MIDMLEAMLRAAGHKPGRWRMSQDGPFSAARLLLFCAMADSNIGERKSGALLRLFDQV